VRYLKAMGSDDPAAHSMDTEWFAVDAEGHVARFESGYDADREDFGIGIDAEGEGAEKDGGLGTAGPGKAPGDP